MPNNNFLNPDENNIIIRQSIEMARAGVDFKILLENLTSLSQKLENKGFFGSFVSLVQEAKKKVILLYSHEISPDVTLASRTSTTVDPKFYDLPFQVDISNDPDVHELRKTLSSLYNQLPEEIDLNTIDGQSLNILDLKISIENFETNFETMENWLLLYHELPQQQQTIITQYANQIQRVQKQLRDCESKIAYQ